MGEGRHSCDIRAVVARAVRIYVFAVVVTAVITLVGYTLPVNLMPNLAICPIIGLLFGPFGALGVDTVSFVDNILSNSAPLGLCLLDCVTTFMISYIPYRLWYSTFLNKGCEQPMLNSVWNVSKFILVLILTGLSYSVLYNLTYGILDGTFILSLDDAIRLMNVVTFSLVYGFAAVILLRYLGIQFYTPADGCGALKTKVRLNPKVCNISLVLGMLFPCLVLTIYPTGDLLYPVTFVTYVFFILFLLKPMGIPAEFIARGRKGGFNNSLIERIIVIFLLVSIIICALIILSIQFGLLQDILGLGKEMMILFYLGLSLTIFFIPAIWFLWYVERKVTSPLMDISRAAATYISSNDISEGSEVTKGVYSRYLDQDSEIGDLATSLTKMVDDMEGHVRNIKELRGKQEKIEAELSVAQNIQASLIPTDFSSVEGSGAHVGASMTPAKYVGGDLYDFFMVDETHLAFMIGDVSGKGVPAALFMAITRALIEGHTSSGKSLENIIANVNNGLCNERNMFVTAWMGILDVDTGVVEFVNAGHNPPILRRKGAPSEYIRTKPGFVLGGMEDMVYKRFEVVLEPGDRIFLYTDGVTEANADYGGFYGEERLLQTLDQDRNRSVLEDVHIVREDVLSFMDGSDQFDDITLLEVEYVGRGD